MKFAKFIFVLVLIAAAAGIGWQFGRDSTHRSASAAGRKVQYYQCAMHPWIKSDHPGNCTICGMQLTPVFAGEKGMEPGEQMISLSSNAISVVNVQSEPVEKRALHRTLEVAGKIEAEENRLRAISAYVDGRIEKLFVNYTGAEVEQGQPLAVIYSPSLLTAEREYLTAATETNLNGSADLAAEHQRLVEGARQRLKRLGLTDEQIEDLRGRKTETFTTQIVAPVGGTVTGRSVVEGQYVKEGDKLFEIADRSKMWFRFDVYEQDLPMVHAGEMVQVSSPALGNRTFTGPITFIDPNISEATRSARVRVELDNPADEHGFRPLKNGIYASGRIVMKTAPVLAVAKSAVLDPGDQARVYVDHGGGAYEQRPVTLGFRGEDYVEVLSGLAAGEKVVSAGNLLLDSQAQIRTGGAEMPHSAHEHPNAKPEESSTSAAPAPAAVTAEQLQALEKFLALIDKASGALASDDLAAFNAQRNAMGEAAKSLPLKFKGSAHLEMIAAKIASAAALPEAKELAKTRSEFLPLSIAAADLTRAVREHGGTVKAKVYKCPMYPASGKNALWVQIEGPLRNPFFGSSMIDCGVEVK